VIWLLVGGIGLFLLGMVLMTEGLRSAAGDALRQILSRFVSGPISALASGAGLTMLVQSSSAVTVATIGFVSAGLVSFPQAIGVLLGANLGTTSTGWIVSVLGFKLDVRAVALPLIGVGALSRLLGAGRTAALGTALSGFGLIFVGIDTLKKSMEGLAGRLDVASIAGGGAAHVVVLVGFGIAMTIVLQSSSAAVATTLTALHGGAIHLGDAALLVVGQNVGTTVTAALAGLGATVPARRTAAAHVLFNLAAAFAALAILPLLLRGALLVAGGDDAMALAASHTGFNLLGVLLVLPWLRSFAAFVERLVPERGSALSRYLDPSVAAITPVAVEAARRALAGVARLTAAALRLRLAGRKAEAEHQLGQARAALEEVRTFLAAVRSEGESRRLRLRHLSVLHALDHLQRLAKAASEQVDEPAVAATLAGSGGDLAAALVPVETWTGEAESAPAPTLLTRSAAIAQARRAERVKIMERTAAGELDPVTALARNEALRWFDRLTYHLWRAIHHLGNGVDAAPEVFDD